MSYASSAPPARHSSTQEQKLESLRKTEAQLLVSARNALLESDEIATYTASALHTQTEQLDRIKADSQAIDSHLDQSEYLLRGMKPFGWVRNLFKKRHVSSGYPATSLVPSEPARPATSPIGVSAGLGGAQRGAAADTRHDFGIGFVTECCVCRKLTLNRGDVETQKVYCVPCFHKRGDMPEEAQSTSPLPLAATPTAAASTSSRQVPGHGNEQVLDDIEQMLDGLKHKTQIINRTLDQHNQMIPDINDSINRNQERMKKQSAAVKKL